MTPENVETRCWVMKTVWQQIPGRRARNSETSTTITGHSIPRNDQLPLTGGPQMMTTGDVGCLYATVSVLLEIRIKHRTSLALHCYNNASEKFYKTITIISPIPTTQSCPNEQLTLHNTVQLYTGYITHDCPLSLCRSSLLTSEPVCRDTSPSHQHFAVA